METIGREKDVNEESFTVVPLTQGATLALCHPVKMQDSRGQILSFVKRNKKLELLV